METSAVESKKSAVNPLLHVDNAFKNSVSDIVILENYDSALDVVNTLRPVP